MAKQLGWLPKLRILEEEIGEEEAGVERLKNPPPVFPPEPRITMRAAPPEPWWRQFGRQMAEQYQPAWLSPQERKELGVEWWQNPRLREEAMFTAAQMALPAPLIGNVPTRALRQLAPKSKALKSLTAPAVFAEELPGKALGAVGRTLGRGTREAKLAPQRGAIGKESSARAKELTENIAKWKALLTKGGDDPLRKKALKRWIDDASEELAKLEGKLPIPKTGGEFPLEKPIDEMTSEELGKLVAVRARQEAAKEAAETAAKAEAGIAAQAPKPVGAAATPLDEMTTKWAKAKTRNSARADADLKSLEKQGYDVEEARDALREYKETLRADFEDAEEFAGARTEAWDNFVDSIGTASKEEAAEAIAKPLAEGAIPPPPPEVPPVAKMLPEEADDLIGQFVKIIKSPKAEEAWELTKELRRPIHARRFAAFGDEYRRLVDQGMNVEEAIQKASAALKGKYPLQSLSLNDSPELRQALFTKLDKVARETNMLEGEVIATAKALEDALKRGNIPRTPGVKGGSAYTRLLKVFDKEVVDILDKPGKLVDILLGPVEQIDREALDALAKLPDIGQQLPMIPVGKKAKVLAALQKAGVNIIESFNLVRSFRSAYDLSMPFRQGLAAGVRHPVNWLREWKPMVKALVNEDFATAFNKSLTADADVAEAVAKDWLDMISLERAAPYMKRLESFASRWAESIPGVRQSQRAAATFVNALMVDNYKAGVNVLRKAGADSSEFKAFAELVNISVGRGSIPKFAQRFAPTLNALLFSPRLLAARLELPFKLASSSPMVRKEAAKTMVSLLGFGALVLGLFKMAGGKPEFDPRGTEVGKVRIGNTRLDFWGGYIQYVRFMGQLLSGKRKTTEGTIQEVDRARLIARFFQSKEAPMLSLFTDLISGETFSGEKVRFTPKGIGKLAYENLAPFGISDFIEAVMEEGELGIIPGILAQTGVGAVTYGGKQKGGKIDLGGLKIPKFEEFKLRPSGSEGFDLSKLKIPKFEESKLR